MPKYNEACTLGNGYKAHARFWLPDTIGVIISHDTGGLVADFGILITAKYLGDHKNACHADIELTLDFKQLSGDKIATVTGIIVDKRNMPKATPFYRAISKSAHSGNESFLYRDCKPVVQNFCQNLLDKGLVSADTNVDLMQQALTAYLMDFICNNASIDEYI